MEVMQQLNRMFTPDFRLIKKRIEDLIEREFLERDKDNNNLYRCGCCWVVNFVLLLFLGVAVVFGYSCFWVWLLGVFFFDICPAVCCLVFLVFTLPVVLLPPHAVMHVSCVASVSSFSADWPIDNRYLA